MRKIIRNKMQVSAVIGVILMVAITISIGSTVGYYAMNMTSSIESVPIIVFAEQNATSLHVLSCPSGIDWDGITIISTDTQQPFKDSSGEIKAGDTISNCYGEVSIIYKDTTVLCKFSFKASM